MPVNNVNFKIDQFVYENNCVITQSATIYLAETKSVKLYFEDVDIYI